MPSDATAQLAEPNVKARPIALEPQKRPGRPSLVSTDIAETIAEHIQLGAYWEPACEAAGVSYGVVRQWLARAEIERKEGLHSSEYVKFADILARATHIGEVTTVRSLTLDPDWRARAFVLERRHRERWGKAEAPTNVTNVVISDALVTQLSDAMRVAGAPSLALPPAIDVTATSLPQPTDEPSPTEKRTPSKRRTTKPKSA